MSERMKTIVLLVGLVICVLFRVIYQITTTSSLEPLSHRAISSKQEVIPLTKTKISMETDHVTRRDLLGQWKSIKLPEEKVNIQPDVKKKEDFGFVYNNKQNITDSGAGVKYAVISASTPTDTQDPNCYNYVFDLPLTVIAWQRMGFGAIIFISGSKAKWEKSSLLNLIYGYLKDLKAQVIFIEGKKENLIMLSQTLRLFACCVNDMNADDYLVTSDSDLWPINPEKYTLPPRKLLLSTFSRCCGNFTHKSERYRMLPLASIGAKVSTWREIMFGDGNTCINVTSTNILEYFAKEFGPMVYNPINKGENDGWYLDQHMASVRIEHWIRKQKDLTILEFPSRDLRRDRLDRASWHPRSLGSLTDTHLLQHLYRTNEWRRVQPVFHALYGEGTSYFSLCQRYRQDFVAEMESSLKVTV